MMEKYVDVYKDEFANNNNDMDMELGQIDGDGGSPIEDEDVQIFGAEEEPEPEETGFGEMPEDTNSESSTYSVTLEDSHRPHGTREAVMHVIHSPSFQLIIVFLVLIEGFIVMMGLWAESRKKDTPFQCPSLRVHPTEVAIHGHVTPAVTEAIEHGGHGGEGGHGTEQLARFVRSAGHSVHPDTEAHNDSIDMAVKWLNRLSLTILILFTIEIVVKLVCGGIAHFLHYKFEIFDSCVVLVSLTVEVVEEIREELAGHEHHARIFSLVILLRLWMIIRVMTAIIHSTKAVEKRKRRKLKRNFKILNKKYGHLEGMLRSHGIPIPEFIVPSTLH